MHRGTITAPLNALLWYNHRLPTVQDRSFLSPSPHTIPPSIYYTAVMPSPPHSPHHMNLSTKKFWIDSKDMKMIPWPGTTRPKRGTKPRMKVWGPSCFRIWEKQSSADLYLAASRPARVCDACLWLCLG